MEYYMQKTYYKTASLISNSCKAIAILAGQTAEVAVLAFEYGKNLVCIFVDLQSIVWCFQLQIACLVVVVVVIIITTCFS